MRRGLFSRTQILEHLDSESWIAPSEIAIRIHVTSQTVVYHLRNMEREKIVERDDEGKKWRLGPFKQSELIQFLSTKKKRKK